MGISVSDDGISTRPRHGNNPSSIGDIVPAPWSMSMPTSHHNVARPIPIVSTPGPADMALLNNYHIGWLWPFIMVMERNCALLTA